LREKMTAIVKIIEFASMVHRRAGYRAIGAVDAAVALLGLHLLTAPTALIEILAVVRGHGLGRMLGLLPRRSRHAVAGSRLRGCRVVKKHPARIRKSVCAV